MVHWVGPVGWLGTRPARIGKAIARQLGLLPQSPVAPEGLTVRELVAQGRYPYQSWFQQWSEADERAVE